MLENPRIGLTGPRTTTVKSWQGRAPAGRGHRVLRADQMLAFFCTMFRREVFDQVGLLDVAYGVGLGDDDEYCRRAQRAGWNIALVQDLIIPHHHRTTFHTVYTPEQVLGMQQVALDRLKKTA
jgi:GT2 family glycosyltransferase